jgi:hypothetical protein
VTTITRCWEVSEGTEPRPLQVCAPRLEEHLEDWLERDVAMLSENLLVIGRQVGNIDLLAIDGDGRLVVIELKRDRVPRQAIAQAVDYASTVSSWSPARVVQIGDEYLASAGWNDHQSLDDAFLGTFGKNLDEVSVNKAQRVVLVGVQMEPGVERMVEWLSENGVDVNVALFTFHALEDDHFVLARTFALSEEVVAARDAARSGRRQPISEHEFDEAVARHGLEAHVEAFAPLRRHPVFRETWGVDGLDLLIEIPREEKRPLRRRGVQLLTALSRPGVLLVGIWPTNLGLRLGVEEQKIEAALAEFRRDPNVEWRHNTELTSPEQAAALVAVLLSLVDSQQ